MQEYLSSEQGQKDYAFNRCTYLKSIEIPQNIKYIGTEAYQTCVNVVEINYNAFNCTSVANFAFSYSYTSDIRDVEVNIGRGVKYIPPYIFDKDDISKVNFEEGSTCETIDTLAFNGANFSYIILPNSLKTIGNNAFSDNCAQIYFLGNTSEWESIEKTATDYQNKTIYYYIEDATNLPQSGNFWHYDTDNKSPLIWEVSRNLDVTE